MPLLDRVSKLNYLEVNVYTQYGEKGQLKLEKRVYVPWSKIEIITADNKTYGVISIEGHTYIVDPACYVLKDKVVSLGPVPLITAGHTISINIQKGNAIPLQWSAKDARSSKGYEDLMETERNFNFYRSDSAAKIWRQMKVILLILIIGFIGFAVVTNLPQILTAIKGVSSAVSSGGGAPR